jgi:hypothetical protein
MAEDPSEHLADDYAIGEMDRVTGAAVTRPKGVNLVLGNVVCQPRPDHVAQGRQAHERKTAPR